MMMKISISTSKTLLIILVLFFSLFLIPSSTMGELERSSLVKNAGAVKEVGERSGYIPYRALRPLPPRYKPGNPYRRGCHSAYYCQPPHLPASPPPE